MGSLSERLTPAPKPAPNPAARTSGLRAAIFLGIAVIAALGAGFLILRTLERRTASAAVPTRTVVVAAIDVPAAAALKREHLKTVEWPAPAAPEAALSDASKLEGRVAVVPIFKGEPIFAAKLASEEAGQGLAAVLPPMMRAVAVRVDDVVGVAGFLHPGDRVDVIVTMKATESSDVPPTSKIILQNVKVLAVGKELDQKTRNAEKVIPVTVATLMVDSEQSEKLALAASKGHLLLSLRSRIDAEEVATAGVIPTDLVGPPIHASQLVARQAAPAPAVAAAAHKGTARRAAVPALAAPPPAPSKSVEILRGDLFEKRQFLPQEAKP